MKKLIISIILAGFLAGCHYHTPGQEMIESMDSMQWMSYRICRIYNVKDCTYAMPRGEGYGVRIGDGYLTIFNMEELTLNNKKRKDLEP
jgi:hypothetical protein